MKKIDESNYKTELPRIAVFLPRGTKQEIADETGENYTTVHNVWRGLTFKQNVVDAMIRRYNHMVETLKPVKA